MYSAFREYLNFWNRNFNFYPRFFWNSGGFSRRRSILGIIIVVIVIRVWYTPPFENIWISEIGILIFIHASRNSGGFSWGFFEGIIIIVIVVVVVVRVWCRRISEIIILIFIHTSRNSGGIFSRWGLIWGILWEDYYYCLEIREDSFVEDWSWRSFERIIIIIIIIIVVVILVIIVYILRLSRISKFL